MTHPLHTKRTCLPFAYRNFPTVLVFILAFPAAQRAIQTFAQAYDRGTRRTMASFACKLIQYSPRLQEIRAKKLGEQYRKFQLETQEKWKQFTHTFEQLPAEGLTNQELFDLIWEYNKIVRQAVEGQQFSGAVYPAYWMEKAEELKSYIETRTLEGENIREDLIELTKELHVLYVQAYGVSYLWNPLHANEFPPGEFIHYQLIQMIAHQFGGKTDEAAGFVTSGGTESLMTAVRAYLAWGKREKGVSVSEAVIIAPDSIHAAVDKAQIDYGFRLIKIPTDEIGKVDMKKFAEAARKHQKNLVALFCSAPSYPKGKIDPVRDIGVLGHTLGCGVHVDCCLGGGVVEYLRPEMGKVLQAKGITSLSDDPHKHGMTPKGCSVLVTKAMPEGENLAFYPSYAIPDWTGGIYATPTVVGSQSSVASFAALLGLLKVGSNRYRKIALELKKDAGAVAAIIKDSRPLTLLGDPEVNVVAFGIDPASDYEPAAIYAFTYEMQKRGFHCSNVGRNGAHFCLTARFIADKSALDNFELAVKESCAALEEHKRKKDFEGISYPGEFSLYGQIGAALHPEVEQQGISKYVENYLMGEEGTADTVHYYCLAHLNPNLK